MKLFLHDGIYHVEFTDGGGKRHTLSTEQSNLLAAQATVAAARIDELEKAAGIMPLTGEVVSRILSGTSVVLFQAIANYEREAVSLGASSRTVHEIASTATRFAKDSHCLHSPPAIVSPVMVAGWINNPANTGKASSRLVRLSHLRSFFSFCVNAGWSHINPAASVKVDMSIMRFALKERKRKTVFSEEEFGRLLMNLDGFWRDASVVSYDTGLRLGDICRLEHDSFKYKDGLLVVWTDKTDKRLELRMTHRVAEIGSRRRREEPGPYLWPEERAMHLDPKRRGILTKQFKRKCESIGLGDRSFHCLRATFATEEYNEAERKRLNPASAGHVAGLLGHSSTVTTRVYVS